MTISDLIPGATYLLTIDDHDFNAEYVYCDPTYPKTPFAFRDPKDDHGLFVFVSLDAVNPIS